MRPFDGLTPERRVRALMALRGLTQADVAAQLGVSQPVLSRRLTRESRWGGQVSLGDVAKVLEVDEDVIESGAGWPDMTGGGAR